MANKKIKFGRREAIYLVCPSLDLVEEAVQKLRDSYQEALDSVLIGNRACRNKRSTLDLRGVQLLSFFNYDWLRTGNEDSTRIRELTDELRRIGNETSIEGDLVVRIAAHPTSDFEKIVCDPNAGDVYKPILYMRQN